MDIKQLTIKMTQGAENIKQLTEGFSIEQAMWKPDADTWSVVEVINHLYVEERDDFRARLARGWGLAPLHTDAKGFISYDSTKVDDALKAFLAERDQSLIWLEKLEEPDWNALCDRYKGKLSARNMMVSWLVHDVLHMRQLVELHYAHIRMQLEPNEVDYAGEW